MTKIYLKTAFKVRHRLDPSEVKKPIKRDMNTYIEYLGLNRLSTASTVWSLKNLFMVKTRVMKIKDLRELKKHV